jgi:hypothetical protein
MELFDKYESTSYKDFAPTVLANCSCPFHRSRAFTLARGAIAPRSMSQCLLCC